ncbi:MAG: DUF1614 domain-containing protein [Peptococcaceae bacterium]|nr:DUF1614 domain-containing protein [Peptococcaceae bacterium]
MERLPLGIIVLIVVSVLIYLGLAHRVLDRMRLNDKTALVILGLMIVGSLIDLPLTKGNITVALNIGGGLVPIGLAFYLLGKAEHNRERINALMGALVTGAVVFVIGTYLMTGLTEPAGRYAVIDVLYIYPIVAAVIAYAAGRSRRGAFVSATLGVLLADIFHLINLAGRNIPGMVHIGGAGAFDVLVISGVLAVLLVEIVGEARERLQGGPQSEGRGEGTLAALKSPEDKGGRENEN